MKKTFTKVASVLYVAALALWTSTAVAQSECATALPIACGDPNVIGDTTGDTPGPGVFCGTSDTGAPAHWYVYTEAGAGQQVTVSTCNAGTNYDTKLIVWDGTLGCAALNCIDGNDDIGGACGFSGLRSEVTFCTLPGGTYYIQVYGFSTNAGQYELSIACAAAVFGCTDAGACNFDPLATCDDGTCDFVSCAGCTDGVTPACNYDPLATIDDGSCDYSCIGCTDPLACNFDIAHTVDDGSCCLLNCVTVNMYDSFGDSWNGSVYNITDDTGALIATGAHPGGGNFSSDFLCLPDGCYFFEVTSGSFDSEINWDLLGPDGGDILGGIAPSGSINFTLGGAPCLGCTDPAACNFESWATVDDGSCCPDNCVFVTVGNNTFAAEVSWDILDGLGNIVLSGGAPFNGFLCLADDCYTVEMFDSFGDGWGSDMDWTDELGNNLFNGTCPDDAETHLVALNLVSGCTNPLASNFDPLAVCDDGSCAFCQPGEQTLTLDMTDTFGDGWNGSQYFITDEFGNLVAFGDLDNADSGDGASVGQDILCLADGCYAIEITAGSFPGEVGFDLQDQLGNTIFDGVAPFGAPFGPLGFLLGAAACDVPGCTDPVCLNFNPYATVDDGTCVCPPDNNDCVDAEALFCGASINGTTVNSGDNEGLIGTACDAAVTIDGPGVWYVFNGNGDNVQLSTCATTSGFDTKISVFEGAPDCSNLICIGGNDDSPNCTAFLSEFFFNTTAGIDYYVLIHGFGGATGDFTLDVTCIDCTGQEPANDDCDDALTVVNGATFNGSTCCNSADVPDGCTPLFATPYGAWYTMNSGTGACSFIIDLVITGGGAAGVSVFEDIGNLGCTNLNTIACCGPVTGQCFGDLSAFYTVVDNTDYYFFVYTTDPVNCGTWDFTVTLGICGCTDPLADNYDPAANIDDGSCTYTLAPPNDLICTATALPCGTIDLAGTLGNATALDAPLVAGCNAAAGPGVWYTFTATGEYHTIETCGSTADTQIDIYTSADGTCLGTLTCVFSEIDDAQAGAGCGFFEQDDTYHEFVDDGVSTYYIYVSSTDGNLTGFEITNDCAPVVMGCTDPCATNYDPLANVDNGTCDYFTGLCAACPGGVGHALNLDMTDAFGDGWNGATYEITDALGNVVQSGSLDAAQCSTDIDNFQGPEFGDDYFCICDDGCYSITVGGGSWDSEIGWTLFDELGGVVASGGAPQTVDFTLGVGIICGCTDGITPACNFDPLATNDDGSCEYDSCAGCLDPAACNWDPAAILSDGSCCYDTCVEFHMFDSFGDGWNGGTYEIYDDGGALVATGDLDNAQSGDGLNNGIDIICMTDGCYTIEVGGGTFDGEISWVFLGVNGVVTGGATVDPVYFSVGTGVCVSCQEALACNYDPVPPLSDCTLCDYSSCLGCTYAIANNYDPLATIDDGNCDIDASDPCPFDTDDNGLIDTLDLLAFLGVFGTTCP